MKNANQLNLATWNKESMWSILEKNDEQLIKALLKLYKYQTSTEQYARNTLYFNSVGFNGTDGKFLSSLATFYQRFNRLSSKQLWCLRKRMKKYSGQLAKIANGELDLPSEPIPHNRKPRNFAMSQWSR